MLTVAEVAKIVGYTPNMTRPQAELMSKFIGVNQINDILELGFRHGVSTCVHAALARRSGGRIVSIDLVSARENKPKRRATTRTLRTAQSR